MIAGVIFDLDGVLLDSEGAWDAARRELVAERGGSWSESATRDMLGMSSPEWSRYLAEELGVEMAPEAISERVLGRVLAMYEDRLPLLPGAIEAVERVAGPVAARARDIVEPRGDRPRSRTLRARPPLRGVGLIGGGGARKAGA